MLLKTKKHTTYAPPNKIFFIIDELDTCSKDLNSDFTLNNCLVGSVKLAKNTEPDRYVYIRYGIELDSGSLFSLPNCD